MTTETTANSATRNGSSITMVNPSSASSFAQSQVQEEGANMNPGLLHTMNTIQEEAYNSSSNLSTKRRSNHNNNEEQEDCHDCSYREMLDCNTPDSNSDGSVKQCIHCGPVYGYQPHQHNSESTSAISLCLFQSQREQNQEHHVCLESANTSPLSSSSIITPSCQYNQTTHYQNCPQCHVGSSTEKSRDCGKSKRNAQSVNRCTTTAPTTSMYPSQTMESLHKNTLLNNITDSNSFGKYTSSTTTKDHDESNERSKRCCCCCCFPFSFSNREKQEASTKTAKRKKRNSHKRLVVFLVFMFFILGAFAAFFCWPRTPRIIMGEGGVNSISGPPDWWGGQQNQPLSVDLAELPARPSLRATWQLNVTVDNRDNWIPTHIKKLDFVLLDSLTLAKFATSTFPPAESASGLFKLAPGAITTLTLTFHVYYQAADRSDPTFQNLYEACGPVSSDSKERRPSLNVLLKVYFHIFGISWVPTVTAAPYYGGLLCPQ